MCYLLNDMSHVEYILLITYQTLLYTYITFNIMSFIIFILSLFIEIFTTILFIIFIIMLFIIFKKKSQFIVLDLFNHNLQNNTLLIYFPSMIYNGDPNDYCCDMLV